MTLIAETMPLERRDVPLEEAFRVVTEGTLPAPNALQQALFPRLLTQDTGLLIPTGPGAGRLEAIFIPAVVGMRTDEVAHRLFIISPDGSPLDDYVYRLGPYLRSLVINDGIARTIWFEEPERTPIARRYQPDGSFINGAAYQPFGEDVDVIVMQLTHFRRHFFAMGGVHGVPEALGFDTAVAQGMAPRGLFYFDEAFSAAHDQRLDFMHMVEFLFAQDLDVVVGSSSLPESAYDALSFLEPLIIPELQAQPARSLSYTHAAPEQTLEVMEQTVRRVYFQNSRVFLALNDSHDARLREIYERLSASYPNNVFYYSTLDSRAVRGRVYAQARELEKEGEGYLMVVDGPALEVSDLDATFLITEPCSPLNLLRRAARCNRRGESPEAFLHVVGDPLTSDLLPDAAAALQQAQNAFVPFDSSAWKALIA